MCWMNLEREAVEEPDKSLYPKVKSWDQLLGMVEILKGF